MIHRLDVTNETCPMTYVKTRLKLDKLKPGERLEVLVNPGEPLKNIPQSGQDAGYKLIDILPQGEKYLIVFEK
jgi:tRNA 2-thiouridine synthesizing protein A